MSRTLTDDFREYMSDRYGAKGRRSIRYSGRIDELDILLGVRDAQDFDDKDKKFLNKGQLEELEKLSKKFSQLRKDQDLEENKDMMN